MASSRGRMASLAFTTLLAAAVATAAPARAAPVEVRMAGYMPVNHYVTKAMERFGADVGKATGGAIKVEHYPAATLFKTTNLHQAVADGEIQLGYGTTSWFADRLPAMGIMDLPFLFTDQKQVQAALAGDFGAAMNKLVETGGMHIVAWLDLGFANGLGTNKRLVRAPADMQGLRIRGYGVFPSLTIKALGGAPTTIASAETYTALQRGVVDGALSLATSFYSRKWYEVVDNMTVVPLGYVLFGLYANKDWWDKLPADQRKAMEDAGRTATAFTFEHTAQQNTDAIKAIEAAGKHVHVVAPADFAAWKAKTDAVYDEYRKRTGAPGAELLAAARKYQ